MNIPDYKKFNISATVASLGVLLCWSTGPIFIKLLTGYTDPWMQNLLRYSVSCLFWLPFLMLAVKQKKVDNKIWRRALIPSCANVVMQSFWASAFYHINPAFADLIAKTSVLWIALFSLICFHEERALLKSKRFLTGIILSVSGIAGVMAFSEDLSTKATITGIILSLSTSIMWGVYTISVKKSFKDTDSRYGFAVISIYTVAGLLLLAIVFSDITTCTSIGAKPWLYIIISSLLGIAFGHVLYYVAIKYIGAMIPNLMLLATPFIVLSLSIHIFNEKMTLPQIISGIILLSGSALAIWSQEHLHKYTTNQRYNK